MIFPDHYAPPAKTDGAPARGGKFALVLACAGVAFVYGFLRAKSPDFLFAAASAVGSAFALLLLPAMLAAATATRSDKWHYVFAAAFAMVFGLVLLGSLR